jgi:hypothetical protein
MIWHWSENGQTKWFVLLRPDTVDFSKQLQGGILILDECSGLIIDVDPFLVSLLDYPQEEFIGKTLWDVGPFRIIKASKAAFQKSQDEEYVRYDNLPLEIGTVNVEFVSNVYGENGERVIQCNIRDITARTRAEQVDERLRQSRKMVRRLPHGKQLAVELAFGNMRVQMARGATQR